MGQITVQVFFPPLSFLCFFPTHLFCVLFLAWEEQRRNFITVWGMGCQGVRSVSPLEQRHSIRLSGSMLYLHYIPTITCNLHLQSYTLIYVLFFHILEYWSILWHCVRHVCPILHSILLCITAELITVAIAELHVFCPKRDRSLPVDPTLSDLFSMLLPRKFNVLHLNTFPLLCNLFSLASLPPHSTPHSLPPYCYIPLGSVISLAFSAPSREAFCAFYVQSVFILAKEQSAKAWIVCSPTATPS